MRRKLELNEFGTQDGYVELEALAERAAMGDNNALYNLCEKVAGSIFYHAKYMLGNEMDAEDVTQNVLLRMCEKIGGLREVKAFRAWLCGIEINETRRYIALRAKHKDIVNIEDFSELLSDEHAERIPQAQMDCKGVNSDVMEIVSNLPGRQREAVMLRYYNDLNISEVAQKMSISHQNASKYLSMARKKIRYELEKMPFSARISAIALLPASSLLSDTFQSAAANFDPASASSVLNALALCQQYIFGSSADVIAVSTGAVVTTFAAFKATFGLALGTLSTIFVAGALVLGITLGGVVTDKNDLAQQPDIEGKIVFAGGEAYRGTDRVNPRQAWLRVEGDDNGVTVVEWWVTEAESEDVLYGGPGEDIGDVLSAIRESGEPGEYNLFFRFKDETGSIFKILGNFYISEVNEDEK